MSCCICAFQVLFQREDEQEIAESEHRESTAELERKSEMEADKVRMTKRRDEELKGAMRRLREAQQVEIDAIASAEQSTRFLYVKQYEVCVADVEKKHADLKAWRAEDLKEVHNPSESVRRLSHLQLMTVSLLLLGSRE